ncbi:hypothetical protein EIK77_005287 [Talaromyces pinophilus]|nr:hypothetical protein EIK77_005287 [Talaromyces pinophilus]
MVQSAFDRPEPKHTPNETNDAESDDEFYDAHFPADEEAFAAAAYSDAISTYDRALASCPNYLDYEIAVLKSNISACYLKLEDWKAAVDAATASIDNLDRCLPKSKETDKEDNAKPSDEGAEAIVELPDDDEDESKQLERLQQDDKRREDVKRIRAKALMRRARARTQLDGWANLQGAEEDYKELASIDNLPPQDQKVVQRGLRELPPRIQAAREKEMGEMMGKLKDVSISLVEID